ncbi:MAG: hypothetical protein ACTSXQ_07995 [Alphaproteobacteria bacterium]
MQNVINLFEEARRFTQKKKQGKQQIGRKFYHDNIVHFMRPAKNDNTQELPENVLPFQKRKALPKNERELLLEDMAAGVADAILAEEYDLTEKQVVKYRHNYGKRLNEIRQEIKSDLAEAERKASLSCPIKRALEILKERRAVQIKTGDLFLDGLRCSAAKMIQEANIILEKAGEELLHYPGVNDLPDRSAPSMTL